MAIGARHITVSTSGLAHKIRDFANEGVQVNLCSLHAPNNELRSSIMKINRAFPIENSLQLLSIISKHQSPCDLEYIMLNEVNEMALNKPWNWLNCSKTSRNCHMST